MSSLAFKMVDEADDFDCQDPNAPLCAPKTWADFEERLRLASAFLKVHPVPLKLDPALSAISGG